MNSRFLHIKLFNFKEVFGIQLASTKCHFVDVISK